MLPAMTSDVDSPQADAPFQSALLVAMKMPPLSRSITAAARPQIAESLCGLKLAPSTRCDRYINL
jgi:hypothetical protein